MATMITPENLVYERPRSFTDMPTHYCPGCTHGTAHRLIAEVLALGGIEKVVEGHPRLHTVGKQLRPG